MFLTAPSQPSPAPVVRRKAEGVPFISAYTLLLSADICRNFPHHRIEQAAQWPEHGPISFPHTHANHSPGYQTPNASFQVMFGLASDLIIFNFRFQSITFQITAAQQPPIWSTMPLFKCYFFIINFVAAARPPVPNNPMPDNR